MHISDVESNHGQERSETAATSINDAGAEAAAGAADGTGEQQQMPSEEKANDSIDAGAEAAQDKQQQQKGETLEQGLDPEQAGVPKTLKNLNSTMADIINMPDTATADGKGKANEAESGKYHGQLLPLGRQLANNLPAQSMQEKEREQTPLAGEKLSDSLQAQGGLPTDQQAAETARAERATTSTAAASAWTSKQSSTDVGKTGSCLPQTLPWSGDGDIAKAGAGAGAASIASTMMDGRQTVDFIEGDSFTSTANYDAVDAVANHKTEKEKQLQKVEQQQEVEQQGQQGLGLGQTELMKTSPHTSNRVTTAAEAATGNN